MRILTIHFKNINSLEGENHIDFQQAPFSETGVFAITGPNGSGKSSILDVITLGLYGETFRFNRPAAHVMTQHTAECFAEVEFSINQDKYRSSWLAQRVANNPDGELQPARMQLVKLNGTEEIIASSVQQVGERIAEITGMTFRNFTRSILLAQGDFAAFLNALDNERMDILEKIISTDIYADYKLEASENTSKAQQRLQELTQDLAVVQVLEPAQREALEHDLIDFNEQCTELQTAKNQLTQQKTILENINNLEAQIVEREKKHLEIKTELDLQQSLLAKLSQSQDAEQHRTELEFLNQKTQHLQENKATLAAYQNELNQLQQRLGANPTPPAGFDKLSASEQMQVLENINAQINLLVSQKNSETNLLQALAIQVSEKKAALESVTAWLQEHAPEASLVDNFPPLARLRILRSEIAELEQKQNTASKWLKATSGSLKNTKSTLEKARKDLSDQKVSLQNQEKDLQKLAKENSQQDIEDLKTELQERTQSFAQLYQLAQANQKLDKSKKGFFGFLFAKKSQDVGSEELNAELEKLRQDLKREENIKITLERLVLQESVAKKMAAERHHLIDGKPCPLCGALEHPYSKITPSIGNSQQALNDQQAKLKTILVSVDKLNRQLAVVQKSEQKNSNENNQLTILRSQWLTLSNRLGAGQDLEITNLRLMKQLWDKQADEAKDAVGLHSKYNRLLANIEQTKLAISKTEALIQQLEQSLQSLEAEWQSRPQDTGYEAQILENQQQEKQLIEKITNQLLVLGEKMPSKKKEEALLDRLNVRRQNYQTYAVRLKTSNEELANLAEKEQRSQNEINSINEKLDQLGKQQQLEEVSGLHLALIEKQKLIADKQQLIAQQELEFNQLQQSFQLKLQSSAFNSADEITKILDLLSNRTQIEQKRVDLALQFEADTADLEQISNQLRMERAQLPPDISSAQDVALRLKQINEQHNIANLEAERVTRLLKDQQLMQQKYDAVLVQFTKQQELTRQFQAELDKINAETGIEFRRRVQAKIAGRLLSQTNEVLEKISGRYYLRQVPSEQGLAIEIEDTLQNNARRAPKTLSGGESFVVSLALALGLAELANNGKSVDSLFLDEGFGNLDAESLYTVISTLENLHTHHGKTIGVISHVDSVQKRFKAQLQVIKKPNGRGELRKAS